MHYDILVIGGGASGIIAAITAKNSGKNVAIIEATDRIGKKILTTGNGRCNITNKKIDVSRYHSENHGFPNKIINKCGLEFTKDLFFSLGLPIFNPTGEGNKFFPLSLQASSVVDILKLTLEDLDIPIHYNSKVKNIFKKDSIFNINCSGEIENFTCNKLIMSTGGKTYPKTGSDGSGYDLCKKLGHSITLLQPSLVQLKLDFPNLKGLSGVKILGSVTIYVNDKKIKTESGELLFTDYGISGPPIFQISRIANFALAENKKVSISIDFFKGLEKNNLQEFLENRYGLFSYRSIFDSFIGVINKKLLPIFLKACNVDNIHKPCYELTWQERDTILNNLKTWYFDVTGYYTFTNAQITAGGVDTREINDETLESKKIKNLFFSGELLDVDGDCGGFNLQWAWSSGYIAGLNASNL